MAIRFVTGATGTGDTVTVTKATLTGLGFVDTDTLVLALRQPGSNTITWPSGYSTGATASNSGAGNGRAESTSCAVKYVASVASEPSSYTVSIGGGNGDTITLEITCLSGRANSAATITATSNAASGTSPFSIPLAGGTAVANDDGVFIGSISYTGVSSPWVTTPPSGWTLKEDRSLTGAFYGGNVGICTKAAIGAGALGTLTGTVTLSGASADSYGIVVLVPVAAGGGGTLTAAQGSYTLTGQAAGQLKGSLVSAAQGSYTLLGSTGLIDVTSTAAQGSYALTGEDAALRGPSVLSAAQGSYALTGQAAGFLRTIISAAAQGLYTLSGQIAVLRYSGAPSVSAYPLWIPLVLAKHLPWLRNYTGLTAAAISEADGVHAWAKRGVITHVIYIDVHSVPGYPQPGYP